MNHKNKFFLGETNTIQDLGALRADGVSISGYLLVQDEELVRRGYYAPFPFSLGTTMSPTGVIYFSTFIDASLPTSFLTVA